MTTRTIRLRFDPDHHARTLDAMRALTGHATELTVDNRRVPPPTDDDPWLTATHDDTRRVGRLLMLPVDSGNSCVVPVFDEEADEFRLRLEHDPANGVFTLFSDALPLAAIGDAGCRWEAVNPAVRSVYSRGAPWSDALARMAHLRTLILREADAAWIGGIPRLAGLTHLVVHGPDHLTDLAPFSGLTALEDLTVATGDAQDDLAPLAGLTSLKTLQVATSPALADLSHLADLAPLSGMTRLRDLNLTGCRRLADLSPLAGLAALRILRVKGCAEPLDLTPLEGLAELRVDTRGAREGG